jgi:hypothetical protein
MQHRRRDGRRVNVIPIVIDRKSTSNAACLGAPFPGQQVCGKPRERDPLRDNIFRTNGSQIVRKIWAAIEGVRCGNTRRFSPPNVLSPTI